MKYLINRKTKEHCVCPEGYEYNCIQFAEVQADPEGWIKHDGGECPLPDDADVDVRLGRAGEQVNNHKAQRWEWSRKATIPITHYRPILDDKVRKDAYMTQSEVYQNRYQNQRRRPDLERDAKAQAEQKAKEAEYKKELEYSIIHRLKLAHQAASEIPDLVAELRKVLEPMGLGVMYRAVPATKIKTKEQEKPDE